MKGRRALVLAVALALFSTAGIVGMLLAEGDWDRLFFSMTATPLLLSTAFWLRERRKRS